MLTTTDPFHIFVIVYFANLLLDYPLQSNFEAKWKSKSYYVLFVHSAIWGLGITITILWIDGLIEYWKIFMLVFGHMAMDGFKAKRLYLKKSERTTERTNVLYVYDEKGNPTHVKEIQKKVIPSPYNKKDFIGYIIDQIFHVGQICLALYA